MRALGRNRLESATAQGLEKGTTDKDKQLLADVAARAAAARAAETDARAAAAASAAAASSSGDALGATGEMGDEGGEAGDEAGDESVIYDDGGQLPSDYKVKLCNVFLSLWKWLVRADNLPLPSSPYLCLGFKP